MCLLCVCFNVCDCVRLCVNGPSVSLCFVFVCDLMCVCVCVCVCACVIIVYVCVCIVCVKKHTHYIH